MEKENQISFSNELLWIIDNWEIKENQIMLALALWFTENDILSKTIWIKHLTELLDNSLSPIPFISLEDLKSIVLEMDRDLYKIKKKLKSIIDIDSLSSEGKVLVMSILDIRW